MLRRCLRGWAVGFLRIDTFLSTGLLLLVVSAALAACGSYSSNTGGQPAASPTQSPQMQQCGQIHSLGPQLVEKEKGSTQKAEDCFLQAFQRCQAATLIYTSSGVDSGIIHTFTVASKNGTCSVTDAAQHFIAPSPPKAATIYTCSTVQRLGGEFIVSGCGQEGNVKIPTPAYTSP